MCHEREMSAERRHAAFDGVKGTERRERKKGVSAESPNILSVYVKTCVICVWKKLVQQLQGIVGAWTVPSRKLGSQDVCVCVCESGPLGW